MTEEHIEPTEAVIEAIQPEVAPIEEPAVATKSRKVRSELQLRALEKARIKAYAVRAEKKKKKTKAKRPKKFQLNFKRVTKMFQKMIPQKYQMK